MTGQFDRRAFLKRSALAACVPAAEAIASVPRPRRKPNLLFLWTDEQRADTMAAYGNQKIRTPNLNRLAAQSVVFKNAYVTQPVCTPSRASVMTGLWPHTTGCTKNNIPLKKQTRCLPELLDDKDYKTAYMGKWHLGDEIFAQHGFDEWVAIEDGYYGHYSEGRDRDRKSDYHHFLIGQGYKPDRGGRFSREFCARLKLEHCKPKFLETRACEFIESNRDKPFVLYVNFLEPHMPFFGPLDDLHKPDEVDLPANLTDDLDANDPLRYRVHRENSRARYGKSPDDIRRLISRYWGLVAQVDRSVGGILATLDRLGLADDTVIVYTSDHGDMMGSHHMVEKSVMFEEAVKVPLLVRSSGISPRVVEDRVSLIDIVPTLLDLMKCRNEYDLPGKSLVPVMQGRRRPDEHIFIQWNPDSGALKMPPGGTKLAAKERLNEVKGEHSRAVISPDGWKLVLSDVEKCQLYNLAKDPGETQNLFDSAEYAEIIQRLTDEIVLWGRKVGDSLKFSS